MERVLFVLNAGSSSLKFAIYRLADGCVGARIANGQVDAIGSRARLTAWRAERADNDDAVTGAAVDAPDHGEAFHRIRDWLDARVGDLEVVAAGHRLVHGGREFTGPVRLDDGVLASLHGLIPLAPLHQPQGLAVIRALAQVHPNVPQVACFDTAFHRTMPAPAQDFALPQELREAGVCRYGFHGLSYEYIADALPARLGATAEGRVVVAHLGYGASMCALQRRRSVATTMSFTPLDGLPMGTRCGSLDPAVVFYLVREHGLELDAVDDILQHRSGLLGLSGTSGDMRELLADGGAAAQGAVRHFVYHIGCALGSLAAAMGGLDALVFTGGIGEHADIVRADVCRRAAWLGLELDAAANAAHEPCISADRSRVSAWVIPTNEELVIARHTAALGVTRPGGRQTHRQEVP